MPNFLLHFQKQTCVKGLTYFFFELKNELLFSWRLFLMLKHNNKRHVAQAMEIIAHHSRGLNFTVKALADSVLVRVWSLQMMSSDVLTERRDHNQVPWWSY